jgi:hypothetical protein
MLLRAVLCCPDCTQLSVISCTLECLTKRMPRIRPWESVTLTKWHPLTSKVGTNFSDKRRSTWKYGYVGREFAGLMRQLLRLGSYACYLITALQAVSKDFEIPNRRQWKDRINKYTEQCKKEPLLNIHTHTHKQHTCMQLTLTNSITVILERNVKNTKHCS